MEQLPYIDEHSQQVEAPVDVAWTALLKVLRRGMSGSTQIARILGCDPAHGTAEFAGRPGEAVPGFRVVEAEPGRRLALRGRHLTAASLLSGVRFGRWVPHCGHRGAPVEGPGLNAPPWGRPTSGGT